MNHASERPEKRRRLQPSSALLRLSDDTLHTIIDCLMWVQDPFSLADHVEACRRERNSTGWVDDWWGVCSAGFRFGRVAALRLACRRTARLVECAPPGQTFRSGHALQALRTAASCWDKEQRAAVLDHYTFGHKHGDPCEYGWLCHRHPSAVSALALRVAAVALSKCHSAIKCACVHEELVDALFAESDSESATSDSDAE